MDVVRELILAQLALQQGMVSPLQFDALVTSIKNQSANGLAELVEADDFARLLDYYERHLAWVVTKQDSQTQSSNSTLMDPPKPSAINQPAEPDQSTPTMVFEADRRQHFATKTIHADDVLTLATNVGFVLSDGAGQVRSDRGETLADPAADQPIDYADFKLQPGTRLGRYTFLKLHAEGGIGQVWIALDHRLNREIAIKVLKVRLTENQAIRKRFQREAQIASQLEHPNIVPVHDLGNRQDSSAEYYTMRFLQGKTLGDEIKEFHLCEPSLQDPIKKSKLLQTYLHVCQAIAFAHSRSIVHRDLKPENVMVGQFGEVVVIDWGLAKFINSEPITDQLPTSLGDDQEDILKTALGSTMGTPAYMAPEQIGSVENADFRTDVYQLGAMLYEILTGKAPHHADSFADVIDHVTNVPTPEPIKVSPDCPKALNAICKKAMSRALSDRYQSAQDLSDDLQRYLIDEPVHAYAEPWRATLVRWLRRRKSLVSSVAMLLVTIAIGSCIGMFLLRRATIETEQAWHKAEELQMDAQRRAANEAIARADAQRMAAENMLARGQQLCEQGKIASGLLWLSRSLEKLPNGDTADLERVIRLNLASRLRELTPIKHLTQTGSAIRAITSDTSRETLFIGCVNNNLYWSAAPNYNLNVTPMQLTGRCVSVTRLPNSNLVACAGEDSRVIVLDYRTGKKTADFQVKGKINQIECSHTGNRLAIATDDTQAVVFDLTKQQLLPYVLSHRQAVTAVRFTHDDRHIITFCSDGSFRLWDANDSTPASPYFQVGGWLNRAELTRDGSKCAVGTTTGQVYVWTIASLFHHKGETQPAPKPILSQQHKGIVRTIAFSPDGKLFASGGEDKTARLWNLETAQQVGESMPHSGVVMSVDFADDQQTLLTASADGLCRLWNTALAAPIGHPIENQGSLLAAWFGPKCQTVIGLASDGMIRRWDLYSQAQNQIIKHDAGVLSLLADAEHHTIVTATESRTIHHWQSADGKSQHPSIEAPGFIYELKKHPTQPLVASVGTDSWVRFWDLKTGKFQRGIAHNSPLVCLAFSRDGKLVAAGSWDRTARVWNTQTGTLVAGPFMHDERVSSIAFSPDDTQLITSTLETSLSIWDLASQQRVAQPVLCGNTIDEFTLDPSSQILAVASTDRAIRLWKFGSWNQPIRTIPQPNFVRALAFSRDGTMLATAGGDFAIRLWDINTGSLIATPGVHRGRIRKIAFLDDDRIVSGSMDGECMVCPVTQPVQGTCNSIRQTIERKSAIRLDEHGVDHFLSVDEWKHANR